MLDRLWKAEKDGPTRGWTAPRAWVSGEYITADEINTFIRANMLADLERIRLT